MQIDRLIGLLLAVLMACALPLLAAVAAEDAPADDEALPAAAEPGSDAGEETSVPADSVGGQMGDVSLDRFVPSEEISADGAVSFPVDI